MSIALVQSVIAQMESDPQQLQQNWCVPPQTGRFLALMVLIGQAKHICEVGTSIGYSTLWLAQAAQQTGGLVETIEYSDERLQQAKAHIDAAGLSSLVVFHQGVALDVLRQFEANQKVFDFVFIDAAKQEYLAYAQVLEGMIAPGGMLIADNTRSHREEMRDFLAYMQDHPGFDVAELETPNGQLLARKRR